ncbi:MAG: dihydrolipoyl dehydrogenase [Ectothiorhodospiraceae bacterium]|jgi:dihydrolipoamide dehydrogenase|nr:dihydrolipoyl dehydrogenase [Ectothiorhodospiraceae bacterium]
MSKLVTVEVPDIGDFKNVEIIDVLVKAGDTVKPEDPLITLESDKATIDVPAPAAGVVKALKVKKGDRVSQGSPILDLEAAGDGPRDAPVAAEATPVKRAVAATAPSPAFTGQADIRAQVLVLGSGPGGYTAAFRAADLGLDVLLVERHEVIGGVCLNVGCIPSKALLHAAQVITEAESFAAHGVSFAKPEIDIRKLAAHKDGIVSKLTGGLKQLAKQRKVRIVRGVGSFVSPNALAVDGPDGRQVIGFEHAIIAAGSQAVKLPAFPWDDPRVMDSTDALRLDEVPKRLLVVGGGIIGLEMACVYDALGAKVTVVELSDGLIPGCDRDLVKPLEKRVKGRYENIFLGTKVTRAEASKEGVRVWFEGGKAPESDVFDRVLVAVGRSPNGHRIGAEHAGVAVDERGFIAVDAEQRTNVPHIHAIGDVVGQPMLAHKAAHEGKVAAEVIAGHKSSFDARAIPSVAYTNPEIAWMGLTETEAKAKGIVYEKGVFPWAASGRALSVGGEAGMTKLLFDENRRVIGAGIVGPNAGELIAEAVLALEMGADMTDLGLTIHPHPTLSETLCFAAEVAEGTVTDILAPKRG